MKAKKHKQVNDLVLYRERIGFTQEHVAQLLGTRNQPMLSKMEQGYKLPSLRTALKLAVIYRVPVDFLYSGLYKAYQESIRRREAAMVASRQQQVLPL